MGPSIAKEAPTLREITDAMLRQPLWRPPGTELIYSNTGYGILSRVAEAVTARDFWDVTWENVFEPLERGRHDRAARTGSSTAASSVSSMSTGRDVRPRRTTANTGAIWPFPGAVSMVPRMMLFASPQRSYVMVTASFCPSWQTK